MGCLLTKGSTSIRKNLKNPKVSDSAMIDNLKKTTKEYLFEKKYNKMADRLKKIEDAMSVK